MREYLVTFHKIVLDGAGHDRCIVQRRTQLRARSDVSAVWEAKALFCRALGISDWRLRADTCEVVELAHFTAPLRYPFGTEAGLWHDTARDQGA